MRERTGVPRQWIARDLMLGHVSRLSSPELASPEVTKFTNRLLEISRLSVCPLSRKMIHPGEVAHAIEVLVGKALPEFFSSGSQKKASKKHVSYTRLREDALFERLSFEKGKTGAVILVSLQFTVSFLPECPIPSGPFGYDADLPSIIPSEVRRALDRHWWGAGWYTVDTAVGGSASLQFLCEPLRNVVRPTLDEWAKMLSSDVVAQRLVEECNRIAKGEEGVSVEDRLYRSVDQVGIQSLRGYPVEKMVLQLTLRSQGHKNWYLV